MQITSIWEIISTFHSVIVCLLCQKQPSQQIYCTRPYELPCIVKWVQNQLFPPNLKKSVNQKWYFSWKFDLTCENCQLTFERDNSRRTRLSLAVSSKLRPQMKRTRRCRRANVAWGRRCQHRNSESGARGCGDATSFEWVRRLFVRQEEKDQSPRTGFEHKKLWWEWSQSESRARCCISCACDPQGLGTHPEIHHHLSWEKTKGFKTCKESFFVLFLSLGQTLSILSCGVLQSYFLSLFTFFWWFFFFPPTLSGM